MDLDSQFAKLRQVIIEELAKGVKAPELAEAIVKIDEIYHPEEPYLWSSRFAGQTPLAAAMTMVLNEMSRPEADDEYVKYRDFFNDLLRGAKKDMVSGYFMAHDGEEWRHVDNRMDAMKSYAIGWGGLKPGQVHMHYARYAEDQPKMLLMPFVDWDGVDRIDQLRNYIKFKSQPADIFIDAIKEWGANIFRRLYQPAAQNRCIILKGGQGIGKDHLLNSMFASFSPYYAKFSSNKDQRECWDQVTSSLVLHIEEFDQTTQMSIPFLKDLITRDRVTYRSPYARSQVTRKCVGSFISTVNIDAVLRDETGNRRFAVFDIESINWSYPKDWAPQIAAQFHALYRADYRADQATWMAVTTGNEQFEQVDIVPEMLNLWDHRVGTISKDRGIVELNYADIDGVISDLCRSSGLKSKAILTMLKVNGRSRKTKVTTVYFSKLRKLMSVVDQTEHRPPPATTDKYANVFDDL